MTSIAKARECAIRLFVPGDEPGLIALFNSVFDADRAQIDWDWKYRGYSQPDPPLIAVAECDGQIVGMYPAQRMLLAVNWRQELIYQPVDNAVAPAFRNGVIQKRLLSLFAAEAGRRSPFFFGFPGNRHLALGSKALEYIDLGEFPCYEKPAFPEAPPAHSLRGFEYAELPSFEIDSPGIQALAQLRESQFRISVCRDVRFLSIDTHAIPACASRSFTVSSKSEMLGLAIACIRPHAAGPEGVLYDIFGVDDEDVARALISLASSRLAERGATVLKCWYRGLPSYVRALEGLGYRKSAVQYFRPAARWCGTETEEAAVIREPSSWGLTLGDTDL